MSAAPVRARTTRQPTPAALAATRGVLVRRLLLPRGREQVWKWALIPVGALLALSVRGAPPSLGELGQLALVWLVTEQLGYQARYQLNDLRDRAADAVHPAGAARGRLGFPFTPLRAAAVWGSVALRAALAVALTAVALDGPPQEAAAWFLVVMLVSSAGYEVARERVRREVAAPGSPRARALGLPVLLVVPVGYGLRVWAGYHALRPEGGAVAPAVLVVLAVLCLYTASTLLAWALEGTSFLQVSPDGVRVAPGLGQRAHIALLVAHSGLLQRGPGSGAPPVPTELVVARDRPARRAPGRRRAVPLVWDLAGAGAVALAHAVVAVGSGASGGATATLVAAGALATGAPFAARALRRPEPGPWDARPAWLGVGALGLTVVIELTALALLVVGLAFTAPRALLLVWFVAFVLFQWGGTRASSYVRGFGPLSLVRRPLRWARARRSAVEGGA